MPDQYALEPLDSLTTLSPITGILNLNNDLLISTGHQQSASLTLVRSWQKGYLAADIQQQLLKIKGIKEVFSLILEASEDKPLKQFIFLSLENQTRILEFSGRLTEIEQKPDSFQTEESTIFCKVLQDKNFI